MEVGLELCPRTAATVTQAALLWSLAVQECSMYKDWPHTALDWPAWSTLLAKQELIMLEEQHLLFRGPRCVLVQGTQER